MFGESAFGRMVNGPETNSPRIADLHEQRGFRKDLKVVIFPQWSKKKTFLNWCLESCFFPVLPHYQRPSIRMIGEHLPAYL